MLIPKPPEINDVNIIEIHITIFYQDNVKALKLLFWKRETMFFILFSSFLHGRMRLVGVCFD